jgi:tetratricopeptide (TPR) repeat protein
MMQKQDSQERGGAMNRSMFTSFIFRVTHGALRRMLAIGIPIAALGVASYLAWPSASGSQSVGMGGSRSMIGADSVQTEIASLEKLWKEHSNHGPIALRLGNLYADRGEFAKAEPMFRTFIASDTSATGWEVKLDLARCLFALQRVDDARSELNSILEEHPQHAGALYNLGAIAANTGDAIEATRLWEELVRVHPEDESAALARNGLATLSRAGSRN